MEVPGSVPGTASKNIKGAGAQISSAGVPGSIPGCDPKIKSNQNEQETCHTEQVSCAVSNRERKEIVGTVVAPATDLTGRWNSSLKLGVCNPNMKNHSSREQQPHKETHSCTFKERVLVSGVSISGWTGRKAAGRILKTKCTGGKAGLQLSHRMSGSPIFLPGPWSVRTSPADRQATGLQSV